MCPSLSLLPPVHSLLLRLSFLAYLPFPPPPLPSFSLPLLSHPLPFPSSALPSLLFCPLPLPSSSYSLLCPPLLSYSLSIKVDALTKRSKAAETAFLTSYKRLIDLPDPIPILEQALAVQAKLEKTQVLNDTHTVHLCTIPRAHTTHLLCRVPCGVKACVCDIGHLPMYTFSVSHSLVPRAFMLIVWKEPLLIIADGLGTRLCVSVKNTM